MQFLDSRFMAVVTGIQLGILGSQKLSFCTSASFFFLLVTINFWIPVELLKYQACVVSRLFHFFYDKIFVVRINWDQLIDNDINWIFFYRI